MEPPEEEVEAPADEVDESAEEEAAARARWRERLPELAIQAALVVLAVFLALAADQCREDWAHARLADEARAHVIEEIGRNRAEIGRTQGEHEALLARLRTAGSPDVIYSFAELSDAAWQAANTAEAVQWMDFDWVMRAARAYQLQRLFDTRQQAFVDRLANLATIAPEDPARMASVLEGQLRLLLELERRLASRYDEVLQAGGDDTGDASEVDGSDGT